MQPPSSTAWTRVCLLLPSVFSLVVSILYVSFTVFTLTPHPIVYPNVILFPALSATSLFIHHFYLRLVPNVIIWFFFSCVSLITCSVVMSRLNAIDDAHLLYSNTTTLLNGTDSVYFTFHRTTIGLSIGCEVLSLVSNVCVYVCYHGLPWRNPKQLFSPRDMDPMVGRWMFWIIGLFTLLLVIYMCCIWTMMSLQTVPVWETMDLYSIVTIVSIYLLFVVRDVREIFWVYIFMMYGFALQLAGMIQTIIRIQGYGVTFLDATSYMMRVHELYTCSMAGLPGYTDPIVCGTHVLILMYHLFPILFLVLGVIFFGMSIRDTYSRSRIRVQEEEKGL
jgi:hypothetical protein